METKHTPGPWHDDGFRIYAPTDAADKRAGRVIVEYKHVPDFNYADAALITAAPVLLAALKDLADAMASGEEGARHLGRAFAAIAEAEGQS